MKIYLDQGRNHQLTNRMMPYWVKMGIELVPLQEAELHVSYVLFTQKSKLPKLLRLDGLYYNLAMNFMLENKPIRSSYMDADGIIVQSQYSMEFAYAMFGPARAKIRLIYNGMEDWNDPLPHEGFNVVVASNWRRWKRLEEMSLAVSECLNSYPDWNYYIVGKTTYSSTHPRVRFTGVLNHQEMRELYRKMDVAMHLAKREWCPNVVLEFLGAGIPVLVSDKGAGAAEIMKSVDPTFIVEGDSDPAPLVACKQYSQEWNALPRDFMINVQSKLQGVYYEYIPRRLSLPQELTIEYVAEQYVKFMKELV